MTFTIIDKQTGKKPDLRQIALSEAWAKHLMWCDMEGFAIEQDGTLLLLDECGQMAYCPEDRFEVEINLSAGPGAVNTQSFVSHCDSCGNVSTRPVPHVCPFCRNTVTK